MPKFIDFHPGLELPDEAVERLRQVTQDGTADEYDVRQLELFYGDAGVYCVLEAPDAEAVRKHHKQGCGEVHEVRSLL